MSARRLSLQRIPLDFVLISLYAIGAQTTWNLAEGSVARFVLPLPLLLYLPGYVLMALLFPRGTSLRESPIQKPLGGHEPPRDLESVERVGLGFGFSIALLPLFAFATSVAGLGVGRPTVELATAFVLLGAVVRVLLGTGESAIVSASKRTATGIRESSTRNLLLNTALAVGVCLAVGMLVFGLASPQQGEQFTEAVIVSESDEGELLTTGYPTNLTAETSETTALLLENNEGARVEYTVVLQLQRVEEGAVVENEELARESTSIDRSERNRIELTITPTMTGENLRLAYLVYRADPPSDLGLESAYRAPYSWVDVQPAESAANG